MVATIAFAVPGDLATPTGGYSYDRRIIEELRRIGWQVEVVNLGDGFPFPTSQQREAARAALSAVPASRPIVIDGLAFGVLPQEAAKLRARNPLVALVHHPLALESGLAPDSAVTLHASETAALASARHTITTSATTAQRLAAEFGVPAEHITVARPGSDPAPAAAGSQGSNDGVVRLLAIGSLVPRKGFDVLIAALAQLADLPWRLTIAGDRARDAQTAAQIDAAIAQHGLTDRIEMLGAVPAAQLTQLYLQSDIFTLASRYEGYGMALADAVAHGLAVVATTAGAIPEAVPAGAGILVAPDDAAAFAAALRLVIGDPAERHRLCAAAQAAAKTLPTWQDSARIFAAAIEAAR